MPSSAEVPYFAWRSRPPLAKLPTTVKLPSSEKLLSLARSPIVAKLLCELAFLREVATGIIASNPLALIVGMSDCVQGFEPCKCKGNGHQRLGN
jgi:hypothetical protein